MEDAPPRLVELEGPVHFLADAFATCNLHGMFCLQKGAAAYLVFMGCLQGRRGRLADFNKLPAGKL